MAGNDVGYGGGLLAVLVVVWAAGELASGVAGGVGVLGVVLGSC